MIPEATSIEEQEILHYQMIKTPELEDLPESAEEELRKAPSVDALMLRFDQYDRTIYYAYLKEELERHPELSLETDEEIQALDNEVMKDLFRDGYEYPHIMKIMTNSAFCIDNVNLHDSDMRWLYTTMRVSSEINPLVNLPAVKNARPVHDMKDFDYKDYYFAGLRAILQRKPSLRLKEADPLVAKMIMDSGHDLRFAKSCLEKCSPQFRLDDEELRKSMPIEKREKLYADRTDRVEACLKEAQEIDAFPERPVTRPIHVDPPAHPIPDEKDLPPMPDPDTFLRPNDMPLTEADFLPPEPVPAVSRKDFYDEFVANAPMQDIPSYESMREKLLALRDRQKSDNTVRYWTESIKLIRDALLQIDQQKETCKALYAWAGGIRKGERELHLSADAEVARIFDESRKLKEQLRQNTALQLRELEEQSRILNQFDQLSAQFLRQVAESIEKNPLLRLRQVQEAGDLDTLLKQSDPVPKDEALWAAALRKAAIGKSCRTLGEGERAACVFLTEAGLDKERVDAILSFSPRLRDLPDDARQNELDALRKESTPSRDRPKKPQNPQR